MQVRNKLRTVICGSRFGQFYLEAVQTLPEEFELVGLLAKGSERSKQCAARYGVELYTEVEALPHDIDLACVVLRSGVMGGAGTELSLKLLARGIHVIQEQPVHHKDLAECLRVARQQGVQFQVGDLYVHLPAVRRFLACAQVMLRRQNALYIDAACATQVSFPLMHILLAALPTTRPWQISNLIKEGGPFQVLSGSLGGIPIILRAHNEVDPEDADNHLHLLHRITIGVAGGSLTLVDTHGPVVWQPRLNVPDHHDLPGLLAAAAPAYLTEKSTQILGSVTSDSYSEILGKEWPRAIGKDLRYMSAMIRKRNNWGTTKAQQLLLCSRQWQELTKALGYPVLRSQQKHEPLSGAVFNQAVSELAATTKEAIKSVEPTEAVTNVFTCNEYAEKEIEGLTVAQVQECVKRLNEACLTSMLLALQSQNTLTMRGKEYSEAEIFSGAKVEPRHYHVIRRWLQKLTEYGYLQQQGGYFFNSDLLTQEQVDHQWHLVKEAWNGRLGSPKVIEYLIDNAQQLPQMMRDQQQAVHLLFPQGRMDVANALYRETLMAKYLNQSVAEAVLRIIRRQSALSEEGSRASLRIVELGAGTGATTEVVVGRLQKVVSQLDLNYLFTDISRFFLGAARERFRDNPWMSFQLFDIDQNAFDQGLQPESIDVFIAAGMLNNARNIDQVIAGLFQCLVPGGWILITEPTREFTEMLISQAFMMTPPEDERQKSQATFLSVKQWQDVFQKAGAQEVVLLPNEKHPLIPLGQRLLIVRK